METPTLFPHQREGVEFLKRTPRAGLFDQQGLGKTAQVLVAARELDLKRLLISVPTVVAHNWAREASVWFPGAKVQVLGRGEVDPDARIVIVTHGRLIQASTHAKLRAVRWDLVVADEAHAFKNHTAKRTRAFYGSLILGVPRVWVLTGTPMPNNPSELWTMLRYLAPERIQTKGKPANFYQFRKAYCELQSVPFGPPGAVKVVGARNTEDLKKRLHGFSLRRLKDKVLSLPPVRWGRIALTVDSMPPELQEIEAQLPRGLSDDEFLAALRDVTEFSTWRRLCGTAKAEAAAELLADELENEPGKKVVVFAHHARVIEVLAEKLAAFGVVTITGSQDAASRQAAVEAFQKGAPRVAICNLVAGGVGITLTAAHDVVFVEQSFVPGENLQAADRCHRIGQTSSVLCRVLTLAGSVDELVAEILARKTQMIRSVVAM